jgi:hypothetical protein
MRLILGILLGLVAGVGLWFVVDPSRERRSEVPVVAPSGAEPAHAPDLERRIARLEEELQRLALELAARSPVAVPAVAPAAAPAADPAGRDGRDARSYLQQYVRSFEAGGQGTEYFRLAVDAYAYELLGEICGLVRDDAAHLGLRVRLAAMLGTPRFAGKPLALEALLQMLRGADADPVAEAALDSLRVIGDVQLVPALERLVWGIAAPQGKGKVLETIVALSGGEANHVLERLFGSTADPGNQSLVLGALSPADAPAALPVFERASAAEMPVRLMAAHAIRRFSGEGFVNLVDQWLAREREPQVRAALEAARGRMREPRAYAAAKAVGPPDVSDPRQDHPNAWATQGADMGVQWLELGYSPARRASAVRIHEVCVPGAVVQVILVDAAGRRHKAWEGVDPTTQPGVFEVKFAPTAYAVRAVRIVLDTDKRPGWSEIDAVELVGPDGSAWAAGATASSAYASG